MYSNQIAKINNVSFNDICFRESKYMKFFRIIWVFIVCFIVTSAMGVPLWGQKSKEELDSVIKTLNLKEVVITAKKIKQHGDTISYTASTYLDKNDRSLSDLLRKMPGIEVKSDGQVLYNGQWIKEFYIEGMNMLGDNYGVATKNIDAKTIGSVQVLEGHQDVKMLRGIQRGESPAMNIVLKKSAKGVWSGIVEAAIGYEDGIVWDGSLTLMNFRRKAQNLSVVKSNNTGNDLRKEIGAPATFNSSLGTSVISPQAPSLSEKLTYRNRSFSGSFNQLFKTDEDKTVSFNLNYLNDREKRNSVDITDYISDDLSRYVINEMNEAQAKQNFMGCNAIFKSNGAKLYIKNKLAADITLPRAECMINQSIWQKMQGHSWIVRDEVNFNYRRARGGIADASLSIEYKDRNGKLTIPLMELNQSVRQRSLNARGNASLLAISIPRLMFNVNGGLNAEWQNARPSLLDSEINFYSNTRICKAGVYLRPQILWHYGNKFQWLFNVPVGIKYFDSRDGAFSYHKLFFTITPYTNITYIPSDTWSAGFTASCTESTPDALALSISKRYLNYISTSSNYHEIEAKQSRSLRMMLDASYKSVFDMFFANVSLTGILSKHENATGYEIHDGIIDYFISAISTNSRLWQADQSASKGFFRWNSKLSEAFAVGTSQNENIIENRTRKGLTNYLKGSLSFSATFTHWLGFETANEFTASKSYTDGISDGDTRHTFTSSNSFSIWFVGKIRIVPAVTFHYNDFSTDYRTNVFLNCNLEYTLKQTTLSLQCSNLLNNTVFRRFTDNGIIRHSSEYRLRGRSLLLSITFRI